MSEILKKDSCYQTLPRSLKNSENFDNTAKLISVLLLQNANYSEFAQVYSRIDTIPESALDTIAYDFNIGWYDYRFNAEEKRRIIKEAFKIYRFIGTRYAVETALKSVYPKSNVEEWFEYEGEPYHFRLTIHDNANDKAKCKLFLQKIKFCKNARSVLDEAVYIVETKSKTDIHLGGKVTGKKIAVNCKAAKFSVEVKKDTKAGIHYAAKLVRRIEKRQITAK